MRALKATKSEDLNGWIVEFDNGYKVYLTDVKNEESAKLTAETYVRRRFR